MERLASTDAAAYRSLTAYCKKHQEGITVAGLTAKTALPIEKVRELLPICADEFQARLQVTESGEILYSFPQGFSSRYRGLRVTLGRFFEKAGKIVGSIAKTLFKMWILVMLVSYFILFLLIALAAVLLSVAAQNSSRDSGRDSRSGGGFFFATHLLDMIIRIWFYSELTKSLTGRKAKQRPPRRPLHKAVFSFVFGDGNVNAGVSLQKQQAVLAYIQSANGVLSLPEYMILTGASPQEAENAITTFCVEYGGSPEATEDGTVIYRFDPLMLAAAQSKHGVLYAGPLRRLRRFSSNEKKFNIWFSILNGVNLLFGGYFMLNAFSLGVITNISAAAKEAYLYTFVYHILQTGFQLAAFPIIFWALGFVPLAFSFLFWLIPFVRNMLLKKDNELIKRTNLRQYAYNLIWKNPRDVTSAAFATQDAASQPANREAAQITLINELSAYTPVEVEASENGEMRYSFNELDREKSALARYRVSAGTAGQKLGNVVFDSAERPT